jgi:hypothetical protein
MNANYVDFSMNRVRLPIFVALLSIVMAGAAVAADDQATPATAPSAGATAPPPHRANRPPAGSDDEVICKREDELGSRLSGKKVCMTRRDWRQQSNDAGDAVNNAPRPH